MKRKVIGTTLAAAGLLAGAFLAGGLLLSSPGSSATGSTGVGGLSAIVTPTATPRAAFTPAVTATPETAITGGTGAVGSSGSVSPVGGITPLAPTQAPGALIPAQSTAAPTTEVPPTAVPPAPLPPTAVPPTAVPPAPVLPTAAPPTPVPPTAVPPTPAPVNEAPYVVQTLPGDGANGVSVGSNLEIEFSEPMDEASVEVAFALNPALPGAVTWDAEGRKLTFNPSGNFDYGTVVAWSIDQPAKDASGLEMAAAASGSFRVLRQKTISLYSQPARDGYVYAPPVAASPKVVTDPTNGHNSLLVGTWMRGFLSFDLSKLPADTVEITGAQLMIHERDHHAQAFTAATGSLWVVSLAYGNLDAGDFGAAPLQLCLATCVPSSFQLTPVGGGAWMTSDVSFFVQRDWSLSEDLPGGSERLSQLRLQFQKENAGSGPDVWAEFHSGEAGSSAPRLEVTFAYP